MATPAELTIESCARNDRGRGRVVSRSAALPRLAAPCRAPPHRFWSVAQEHLGSVVGLIEAHHGHTSAEQAVGEAHSQMPLRLCRRIRSKTVERELAEERLCDGQAEDRGPDDAVAGECLAGLLLHIGRHDHRHRASDR